MRILRFIGTGALLVTSSCMLDGPSHTAQGQLYTSGNPTYDGFFREVHQSQVDAASWDDDKKTARKALVTSLELTPDAADVTIVQATHESSSKAAKQPGSIRLDTDGTSAKVVATGTGGDPALFHAIEDAAHNELERAKKIQGVEPKLDALLKQGSDLEGSVKADFLKYGQTKENEVANELVASVAVLTRLRGRAEGEARASEDFVADLGRALETASEDRAAARESHHAKRHEDGPARSASARPAAAAGAQAAPATTGGQAAPGAQKPADTGEVFTP
jgi:hypothetical protein